MNTERRQPLVSIIMQVSAWDALAVQTLQSLRAQTLADWQLCLLAERMPDGIELNDPRIRPVETAEQSAAAWKLNMPDEALHAEQLRAALHVCDGEFIARMLPGDLSAPARIEKQAAFLKSHPDMGLVLTSYEEMDAAGRTVNFRDVPCDDEGLQIELALADRLCHGIGMARREAIERAGGYGREFAPAEEYDLWLRLAEIAPVASLREYLYRARVCGEPCEGSFKPSQGLTAAGRARNAAWRRRAWSLRFGRSVALTAWARAATRVGKPGAAAALLVKSVVAHPLSGDPWRLGFGRLGWAINGIVGRGKAGAIRNENLVRREIERCETVLRSHPTQLMLLMIDACNSKCVMCGGEYFAHRSGRSLTVEKVEAIFDHLRPELLTMAIFAGGGEPLLNPRFDDIAALARARCPTATLTLITNGIALDERRIRTLADHRINALVSINAARAETYRRIHQVDEFERVSANVQALAKAAGGRMDITLSLVGTRRTIAELPALVRLAHEWGAQGVLMSYCRFFPECYRCKSFNAPENRLRDQDSLFYAQDESDRCIVEARRLAAELGVRLEHERLFSAGNTAGRCGYPWTTIFASYDGEVYWCPTGEVLFEAAVETGRYASGNLVKQDIREIRNNDFFVRLRKSALQERAEFAECRVCGNRLEWLGPCDPARHVLAWDPAWKGAPRSGGRA